MFENLNTLDGKFHENVIFRFWVYEGELIIIKHTTFYKKNWKIDYPDYKDKIIL